jgi:hypothetical protein
VILLEPPLTTVLRHDEGNEKLKMKSEKLTERRTNGALVKR